MNVTPGSTDVTTYFSLLLAATGAEATGLTPTNFDLQYVRSGAVPSAKVDASALASVGAAHADNGVIEVDATDQPGLYRVDWPDAAFVAGVREVILTVTCPTARAEHLRVELETLQTGDIFARLGAPVGASTAADIAALQSDTNDIQTRLPAALSGAGNMKSDMLALNGSTTTAVNLALAQSAYIISTVVDVTSPAANDFSGHSSLSSTDNFYQYSILVFISGTLQGIARQVSAYAGPTRTFTFTGTGENADAPFPAAPTNGDSFLLVSRIGT